MTLAHVVGDLRCPHCGAALALDAATVGCATGHRFDVARQGYVNLLPGGARTGTADTAAMVAARMEVFAAGHLAPLIAAVAGRAGALLAAAPPGSVLDLGSGPGAYLAAVLARAPDRVGLALDLSKHAVRRAARAHPRIGAAVCDTWAGLPVRDGAAALVLDVFAPRNGTEIARVLAPGGALLVVTPAPAHLRELMAPLGLLSVDDAKPARVHAQLASHLVPEDEVPVTFTVTLDHAGAEAMVAMGPSAWHVDAAALARRVRTLPSPLQVTAAVTLSVYRRAAGLARCRSSD